MLGVADGEAVVVGPSVCAILGTSLLGSSDCMELVVSESV